MHPRAVRVMAEAGVDIADQFPKPVTTFLGREAVRNMLIVCDHANQSCPRAWPGSDTLIGEPLQARA